jgi:tRNA-specific 2-thiouridylase
VVRLEPETATLWLGPREATLSDGLIANETNLLAPVELLEGEGVSAQIRYRHSAMPCRVAREGDRWIVRFRQPESAVSSGQSVVFYQGDRVLGGARIEEALPSWPPLRVPGPAEADASIAG